MPKWFIVVCLVLGTLALRKQRSLAREARAHEAFVRDSLATVEERVRFVRDSQLAVYRKGDGPAEMAQRLANAERGFDERERRRRECAKLQAPVRSPADGRIIAWGDTAAACR